MTIITGILRNARRVSASEDLRGPSLSGQVYGDTKGRFHDGQTIYTSTIVSEEGDVFRTRFSTYKVESWADAVPVPANDNGPDRGAAINDLVAYFHDKSTAAGWWKDPVTGAPLASLPYHNYVVATKLMLCVSELSEAMEGLRKNLMDDKLPHRKMAEVELGDALIRICDLAGELGYDLGGATMEKDAYNAVRPDHKIGARLVAGGKAY